LEVDRRRRGSCLKDGELCLSLALCFPLLDGSDFNERIVVTRRKGSRRRRRHRGRVSIDFRWIILSLKDTRFIVILERLSVQCCGLSLNLPAIGLIEDFGTGLEVKVDAMKLFEKSKSDRTLLIAA